MVQPIQKQHSLEEHEDSDSDRRRKPAKQKWVPLEIDLTKAHSKRDHSPRRRNDRSSEAQSTVSDGDRDWRAELRDSVNQSGRQSRPASAAPRSGRGRNRGGRRANYNRPANRLPSEPDYPDYPTEYSQVNSASYFLNGQFVPIWTVLRATKSFHSRHF